MSKSIKNWLEEKAFWLRTGIKMEIANNGNPIDKVVIRYKDFFFEIDFDCESGEPTGGFGWTHGTPITSVPIKDFYIAVKKREGVMSSTVDIDKKIKELIDEIWCAGYNCGANNFDDDNTEFIKDMKIELFALIRKVAEEVIGEDEPRGKYNADSLLERDVIIKNIILGEQRTKLNNILGKEK